uniref:Uncharacterized protein n=1 Tax=Arundo donax TaxID=35708 RepID=A0A0A9I037_ARUDO
MIVGLIRISRVLHASLLFFNISHLFYTISVNREFANDLQCF